MRCFSWHEFPHIAFDLDGTLADSNVAQVWAWQDAIEEENLFFPHLSLFTQLGLPGRQLIEKFAFALRDKPTAERIARRASQLYSEHYSRRVTLVDGALKLLRSLKKRGSKAPQLYALSSGLELETTRLLKRLHIDVFFDGLFTTQPFSRLKERIGARTPLISVGDSPFDSRTSAEAGVPFVFVGQGGFPREWFERAHSRFFNIRQMCESLEHAHKTAALVSKTP